MQTEGEEGQTKCRHNRQIVDASGAGQLMNTRRKVGKLNEKNTAGPFWAGPPEKSDIYGWIGCSQSQARMTAENGASLTRDDFARISTPINGRLVSVCIAPLSVCIYIAIAAISFIAISSKWKHAFWLRALFLSIGYFECLNLKWGGHLGITCHPSSLHFITKLIPLHCASPLFAGHRVPALQACAWCPLQTSGAHCKLVVPIANLWSQFGAHCKRPIVQQESVRPGLRQNWNLMRYIWTCTSTNRPHRGFSWYRGKPIEQDWHARLTFFINTQLNLKELEDKNKMIQLMLIGGQHVFS